MRGRGVAQAVALILVVAVVGVAASSILVTNDLPLQTNTNFTVTLEEPGTFPASSPFAANDTIQISSGSVTAGSVGNLTITDSDDHGLGSDGRHRTHVDQRHEHHRRDRPDR
jgi:hypothetical protein